MAPKNSFFVSVYKHTQKVFSIIGPYEKMDNAWFEELDLEIQNGRDIRHEIITQDKVDMVKESLKSDGYIEVAICDIFKRPYDNIPEYTGNLPEYAQHANRKRVVKVTCRGECNATCWAELNVDFPGKDILKNEQRHGIYKARCLKCGYEATDNYNWRPVM